MSWKRFCALLDSPPRTNERHKAYFKLPKTEQDKLKSSDGWYLGGPIQGKSRRKNAIKDRDIITIDIDECSPELFELIRSGVLEISNYEFVAHTTRKHTAKNPRVRINVLCATPVDRDKYDAVSRILGHMIDHTMDAVDDVSFRVAQMMFMPTLSKDQEYEKWENHGKLLDPDELLESWPTDWRDFTNLPFSESRGQKRPTADKAEDPWEKRGPIGAFCRAYPIEDAIATFLPDTYTPGDMNSAKPRYTYVDGSTTNGVVVEDDGRFIYSHHGTDPCSDTLCNSFDMVRLHKFGHEDDGKDLEGKPVTEWPSYKAMFKFAQEDQNVRKEMIDEEIDIDAMFDDISDLDEDDASALKDQYESGEDVDAEMNKLLGLDVGGQSLPLPPHPGSNKPPKPKKGWTRDLEITAEGKIKCTIYNIATIIWNDPRAWALIAYNIFSGRITARRSIKSKIKLVPQIPVEDPDEGLEWSDTHDASLRVILEAPAGQGQPGYGMKVSDRDIRDAVNLVAKRWSFHPVIDRLLSIEWDGVPRVETLFIDYLGTPDTPYYRETAKQFLLGCITRLFHPGHKFDFVPVLSGPQGARKTTFVQTLAWEKYFGELTADMDGDKDAVEQMLGVWIIEIGELVSMRRSEIESIKAFITRQSDRVRLAYDKRMTTFPRQCLFMGTTNEEEYLKDNANRRFWPIQVQVETIDIDKMRTEIDLIWAEALVLYSEFIKGKDYKRLPFGLQGEALEEAERKQEDAKVESVEDQTAAHIQDFLENPIKLSKMHGEDFEDLDEEDPYVVRTTTCIEQIMFECLGENPKTPQQRNSLSQIIGKVMRGKTGWVRYSDLMAGKIRAKRTGLLKTKGQGTKASHQLTIPGYGRQRGYVRIDATKAELSQRYRIVDAPVDDDPDNPEDIL